MPGGVAVGSSGFVRKGLALEALLGKVRHGEFRATSSGTPHPRRLWKACTVHPSLTLPVKGREPYDMVIRLVSLILDR
jgi:hypothetical protein